MVHDEAWLRSILNTADTGWGERESNYAEAAHYLTKGLLTAVEHRLDLTALLGTGIAVPAYLEGGESARHRYAKAVAMAWIASLGGSPQREVRRYNGSVDVFCPVTGICVECGSLSPTRLLQMAMDEEVKRVITIPFTAALAFPSAVEACLAGNRNELLIMEWAMVGDWKAERAAREEAAFERLRDAVSALEL